METPNWTKQEGQVGQQLSRDFKGRGKKRYMPTPPTKPVKVKEMGNCFRSHRMHSNIAGTREPLLRETERDAVSSLLQYLEQGL